MAELFALPGCSHDVNKDGKVSEAEVEHPSA